MGVRAHREFVPTHALVRQRANWQNIRLTLAVPIIAVRRPQQVLRSMLARPPFKVLNDAAGAANVNRETG